MTEETRAPLLSVTVLNYNYARFLPDCLTSILSQSFKDFELILIDDCSKDNSLEVIEPFLADSRVRLIRHNPNQGYIKSLLEGSSDLSRGKYITVISADDLVTRNDAFERQIAVMEAHPEVSFCFSAFEKHIEGREVTVHRSFEQEGIREGLDLLKGILTNRQITVLHSGTVIRTSRYKEIGGYDPALRYAGDTDMWLRLSVGGAVAYLSDSLYGYRIHASQMSGVGDFRGQMRETVGVLERALEQARAKHAVDAEPLRRQGVRTFLFGAAIDEAFRDHYRNAIERCGVVISLRPRDALTARELWIVALRIVLGERLYKQFASKVRSPKSDAANRVTSLSP